MQSMKMSSEVTGSYKAVKYKAFNGKRVHTILSYAGIKMFIQQNLVAIRVIPITWHSLATAFAGTL